MLWRTKSLSSLQVYNLTWRLTAHYGGLGGRLGIRCKRRQCLWHRTAGVGGNMQLRYTSTCRVIVVLVQKDQIGSICLSDMHDVCSLPWSRPHRSRRITEDTTCTPICTLAILVRAECTH